MVVLRPFNLAPQHPACWNSPSYAPLLCSTFSHYPLLYSGLPVRHCVLLSLFLPPALLTIPPPPLIFVFFWLPYFCQTCMLPLLTLAPETYGSGTMHCYPTWVSGSLFINSLYSMAHLFQCF